MFGAAGKARNLRKSGKRVDKVNNAHSHLNGLPQEVVLAKKPQVPVEEPADLSADPHCEMRKAVYYKATDEQDYSAHLRRAQMRMKKADAKIQSVSAKRHLSRS